MLTVGSIFKPLRTALPARRSAAYRWEKVSVIHFDSHLGKIAGPWNSTYPDYSVLDTCNPDILGGGLLRYA